MKSHDRDFLRKKIHGDSVLRVLNKRKLTLLGFYKVSSLRPTMKRSEVLEGFVKPPGIRLEIL